MRTDILTNIDHHWWHDYYHHYHSHPSWQITIVTTVTIILVGVSLTSSPSSPSPSRSWHVGDSYRLNSAWQPGPSQVMLSLLSCHHHLHHHHHHHKMGKSWSFSMENNINGSHLNPRKSLHPAPQKLLDHFWSWDSLNPPDHYHLHHDWLVVSKI